jgi:hypothetical protein
VECYLYQSLVVHSVEADPGESDNRYRTLEDISIFSFAYKLIVLCEVELLTQNYHGFHTRRRWAEDVRDVECGNHDYESPQAPFSDSIFRSGHAQVDPDSCCVHQPLNYYRPQNRVPQSQTQTRAAGIQRQVRPMHYKIQDPVADHANPDQNRAGSVTFDGVIKKSEERGPANRCKQAVRDWIGIKLSGVKAVLPGSMRTCSLPSKTNTGHNKSSSTAAPISVPNEVCGASRFEAKPTAKCPMNKVSLL